MLRGGGSMAANCFRLRDLFARFHTRIRYIPDGQHARKQFDEWAKKERGGKDKRTVIHGLHVYVKKNAVCTNMAMGSYEYIISECNWGGSTVAGNICMRSLDSHHRLNITGGVQEYIWY